MTLLAQTKPINCIAVVMAISDTSDGTDGMARRTSQGSAHNTAVQTFEGMMLDLPI